MALSDLSACCAMAIMAKASVAGAVKTRLVPPLSPAEAAEFNTCCLADIAANIVAAAAAAPIRGFAAYDPAGTEDFFAALLPDGFALLPPPRAPVAGYAGIGRSLYQAACDLLAAGFGGICLVNADSPTLPTAFLREAVRLLQQPGDRVVLGPAADGGYYLIGLKRCHAALFQGIDWSTERVWRQTVARAGTLGVAVAALHEWYDVDDAASLALLRRELLLGESPYRGGFAAPHTRAFVEKLAAGNFFLRP